MKVDYKRTDDSWIVSVTKNKKQVAGYLASIENAECWLKRPSNGHVREKFDFGEQSRFDIYDRFCSMCHDEYSIRLDPMFIISPPPQKGHTAHRPPRWDTSD